MKSDFLDLSIIIIAYNEESRIQKCIESLPAGSELIVIDSGSTDRTVSISEQLGAKVIYNKFEDYSSQRNFGISKAGRSWIFFIDADEILSQKLSEKIVDIVSNKKNNNDLFYIKRSLLFMNKVLRFSNTTDYIPRLFKNNGNFYYEGIVHEKLKFNHSIKFSYIRSFNTLIFHDSYRSMDDLLSKSLKYSKLLSSSKKKGFFSSSYLAIVLRSNINFFLNYFIRLGFLDGYPGYVWCECGKFYTFLKYHYLKER